jgi:hypothetical protein
MVNTKFLGLQVDNHINWKNNTEQMIPELHGACYAIGQWSVSVTLTLSNQFTMHTFIL